MTIHDPYNLLQQGLGLLAWNTNVNLLVQAGERFIANNMQLEATEVSGIVVFATIGAAQRVHVKLVRERSA